MVRLDILAPTSIWMDSKNENKRKIWVEPLGSEYKSEEEFHWIPQYVRRLIVCRNGYQRSSQYGSVSVPTMHIYISQFPTIWSLFKRIYINFLEFPFTSFSLFVQRAFKRRSIFLYWNILITCQLSCTKAGYLTQKRGSEGLAILSRKGIFPSSIWPVKTRMSHY